MERRLRLSFAARALLLAGTMFTPTFFVPALAAAATTADATDPSGDTVSETVEDPIRAPAADIVATTADSRPEGITLTVRVAEPADPAAAGNWLSSFTSLTWQLDITGDGKRDYVLDYYVDEDTKQLTADLDRSGPAHLPDGCEPRPGYSRERGYSVVIDPKCLGGADAFTYRVLLEYTTDALDPGADIATDASPGEGWTGPVAITLAAGVTPVAVVVPVDSPPDAGPSTAARPGSADGEAPTTAPSRPVAATPTSARPVAPAKAATRPSASAAQPDSAAAVSPVLARTGLAERMVRLAGFAVGIGLIGIGLLFANRRPAVRLAGPGTTVPGAL